MKKKKNLFWFLLCRSLSAAPTSAEQAAFQRHPQDSHNHHDQEANDIQRVVLNPVQIVCSYSEVWGPFVSHDKLSPESRQVHRWERTIQVNLRQFHHPLFETTGRYGNRRVKYDRYINPTVVVVTHCGKINPKPSFKLTHSLTQSCTTSQSFI